MTAGIDVAVLAAHPDDAEIGCGGTILKLVDGGRQVAIVDLTRGENSTRGTPERRAEETARATAMLGVARRQNLGLPDTAVRDDAEALRAVVAVIRELRPAVLLAPLVHDAHPDHEATGMIARRAFFHAGLENAHRDLGRAFRPRRLLFYFGNDGGTPTFCVDIGAESPRKRDVVRCYASQLTPPDGTGSGHLLRGFDVLERCEARDRYFGSLCGFAAAEPFFVDGPLPLQDLAAVIQP